MALVLSSEVAPHVLQITLNDPDNLNAMGEAMADEFRAIVSTLAKSSTQPRVIILTGSGRAFSAGGDLNMLEKKSELSAEENHRRMLKFYDSFLSILELQIPLIAAINGHAIGAGLCVACACDVRVAAEKAKLGFTFTKLGLHPGMGATYFLPKVVGQSIATEMVITGRVIEAEEGQMLGLVTRVVPQAEVLNQAKKIAAEILQCGPLAVKQVLANMRSIAPTLTESLEREASCQAVNYASAEFKEGVRATIEKRAPSWPKN